MSVNKKKVIKILLVIILIIIILLFGLLFLKRKTYSKYNKNVKANSSIEVAEPIFIVDGANDIKIDGIEDTTYDFSVKNFNLIKNSDVELNYYIQFENNSNADLEFILTKDNEEVILKNNKTDLMYLTNLFNQEDKYSLKIKYTNNPGIVTDIDGNVQIKVEALQKRK